MTLLKFEMWDFPKQDVIFWKDSPIREKKQEFDVCVSNCADHWQTEHLVKFYHRI